MKHTIKSLTVLFAALLTLGVTSVSASSCEGGSGSQGGDEIASQGSTNEDGSTAYYITIHYQRSGTYDGWNFYAWGDSDGFSTDWTGSDSYGKYVSQPLSAYFKSFDPNSSKLGFIVRLSNESSEWAAKDATDSDRFINFTRLTPNSSNVYHVYLKQNDKSLYSDANGTIVCDVEQCFFSQNGNNVTVSTNANMNSYTLYEDGVEIYSYTFDSSKSVATSDYAQTSAFYNWNGIDPSKAYTALINFRGGDSLSTYISFFQYFKNNAFKNEYNYDGELGAIYTSQHTIFRVWAPTSQEVKLRLYTNGTPTSEDEELGDDTYKEYIMDRKEQGVFEIDIWDDLSGVYYTYVVTNATYQNKEVVDPYAKSTGVNGKRGMVVDFDSELAKPEGWDDISVIPYDQKELVVYETHVADVTSSSTWTGTEAYRKTFKGMAESGTTYTQNGVTVSTGFDNIKELGVNAVQILPFFDQANDEINTSFNWGYNPVNYNALEGSYSTDPYDGYTRIKEFRELVMAYNEAGINIIMDVVYNHMSSANEANFDVLVPGYYYRYSSDRVLADGSGCGNETNSDNYMFHKFMIDSTCFWAETYKLGGFRFDLMGLHDLDTMNDLADAVHKINPNAAIYGEPWSASTAGTSTPANQANASKWGGFGGFNDRIREALVKTNTSGSRGWATSISSTSISSTDTTRVAEGIKGNTPLDSTTLDADHTINYVSCHDNATLYDRIKETGTTDDATIAKMATLANAVVFTSKGTSFMLAGEEFLRTKNVDGGNYENSYNSSYKCNELDYSRKITYSGVYDNYKALIGVKTGTTYLHQGSSASDDVQWLGNNGSTLHYTFTSDGYTYSIYHCNGVSTYTATDLSGYTCVVDTLGYINEGATFSGSYTLNQYETIVARK